MFMKWVKNKHETVENDWCSLHLTIDNAGTKMGNGGL